MKWIILRLCVALVAFCIGVGSEFALKKYVKDSSPVVRITHPKPINAINLARLEFYPQLSPGSLPKALQRIDEKYRNQCQLPTDWYGDWHTVKQLAEFRACNDKWATARRQAIKSEIANYLIQY